MQPKRRSYTKAFKAKIIQECAQPDASIASVAQQPGSRHGAQVELGAEQLHALMLGLPQLCQHRYQPYCSDTSKSV